MIVALASDLPPLELVQRVERHRQEDLLLAADHVPHRLRRRADREGHGGARLSRGGRRRGERVVRGAQQRAGLVVLRPHHLGRSGDPVLLQEREEEVLLAQVVLVHVRERVHPGAEREERVAGRLAVGALTELLGRAVQRGELPPERGVLLSKRVHRVSGRRDASARDVDRALQCEELAILGTGWIQGVRGAPLPAHPCLGGNVTDSPVGSPAQRAPPDSEARSPGHRPSRRACGRPSHAPRRSPRARARRPGRRHPARGRGGRRRPACRRAPRRERGRRRRRGSPRSRARRRSAARRRRRHRTAGRRRRRPCPRLRRPRPARAR